MVFLCLPTAFVGVIANDSLFIDDVKYDAKIKKFYSSAKENNNQTTQDTWAGTVWLNAKTGYQIDTIGFVAPAYRVAKLGIKGDPKNSNDLLMASNEGFAKVGQAWIYLNLPKSHYGIKKGIKIGRQNLNTGLLSTSKSHPTRSIWSGIDTTFDAGVFNSKIAFVNKVSKKTQSGFHSVRNDLGHKIDWISAVQFSFIFEFENNQSIEFQYKNAFAYHYLYGQNGKLTFKTSLHNNANLTLNGHYYHTSKKGNLWQWKDGIAPFDNEAYAGSIDALIESGSWVLHTGVTITRAESSTINSHQYQTIGHYSDDFGSNIYGALDVSTVGAISDFNFDKETAWFAGAEYNFSSLGVEGLSLKYKLIYGTGMRARNSKTGSTQSAHESENSLKLVYKFSQPMLKGLKFKTEYTYYQNDTAHSMATGQIGKKDFRAWLSYSFSI